MSKKSKSTKKPKKLGTSNLKKDRALKYLNLGKQYHKGKNLNLAEQNYRKAIDLDPLNFQALYLLAVIASEVGRYKDGIELAKLSIKANPGYALAHNDLGVMYQQIGDLKNASECYTRALKLNESFAEARNNMGVVLQCQGDSDGATDCFKQAMSIDPQYLDAHTNYIFAIDLTHGVTVQQQQEARKLFDKIHMSKYAYEQKPHKNSKDLNRKLRIGYVSGDLRLHSASFVFGAMIVDFDRENFEVFVYSNTAHRDDVRSQTFKANATYWRNIVGIPDVDIVEMIRSDKIDVLVDLSGFSAGGKLPIFARRPAPVQITAWGYATSTGMKSMDAFFADEVTVPEDEKSLYTEEVVYLPNIVNHYCPEQKPNVEELPALSNGYVTFGSFNRLTKVSDQAFNTWAKVLQSVPNSKMLLKIGETIDDATHDWAVAKFAELGIGEDRLQFLGKTAWHAHMGTYNKVDISLDPFPHGGGVTTLEGLVMGVPVITLRYPTIVGRLSSSILTTLNMTDWIAETEDDYVALAVKKASDLQALSEVRMGLREKLQTSIIGDCPAYVRAVEKEYRKLFEEWANK